MPESTTVEAILRDLFKDSFVMKTLLVNLTQEQFDAVHTGQKTQHDGKDYEIIWIERVEKNEGGKDWNTLLRLKFLPQP